MSTGFRPPPGSRGQAPQRRLDDADAAALLPETPARTHKGARGTVAVVAGSLEYIGAALLAASAAQRAGAGLVALAVPASLAPLFAGRVLEAITLPLLEHEGAVDAGAARSVIDRRRVDALVIGPGLAAGAETAALVRSLIEAPVPRREARDDDAADREGSAGRASPAPAVLDAGALSSLAGAGDWSRGSLRECVLTPHPGEFRRLRPDVQLPDDPELRASAAAAAAREWKQIVVLKGAETVIAAPDGRIAMAPFENPALATAGTGDVLSGTIGALLAQGVAPYDAACLGVYLHGAAGERLRERFGDTGLIASDLPEEIAIAAGRLAKYREGRRHGAVGFAARHRER